MAQEPGNHPVFLWVKCTKCPYHASLGLYEYQLRVHGLDGSDQCPLCGNDSIIETNEHPLIKGMPDA